jgi:hypothetical protein
MRRKPITAREAKIQAALLVKSLRTDHSYKTIQRFKKLPEFANLDLDNLKQQIKLKHALTIIAMEQGFLSWVDFIVQRQFIVGGYLNLWFATYSEAKAQQTLTGGFLLPYKKQFFICDANYLKQIGFDPEDSDWGKINGDWVAPANQSAQLRLYRKWKQKHLGRS